ncbi:glycosyl transferase [Sulfuricaulis limicola]|uniref:Glycosyl transferase n=2 Tax=Sulfuricaulis limicola TaxID=1620215 RepID=A0A1B4XCC2_9GAMM|nr:glycosyl transferase [Sulfuricaulis limicola]
MLGVLFGNELGSRTLWEPDEGRYAEIPREMVQTGDYLTPRLNGVKYFEKPALFYWLQAGAIRVFGLNEWSLRLWTALFALLGCLMVYVAARRLYSRRAGWLAAGVLATSPMYDFLGSIITLDMAVSTFLTFALLAFLLGVREPPGQARRLWLWGFYAACALATLTKGLIGMVLPAMVVGAWMLLLNEWRQLRTLYLPTGLLLFLAIAAPWHVLVARANPEFAQFYFIHEHFQRYLTTVHQRYEPAWFFIPVLVLGMFPWIAFVGHAVKDAMPGAWSERRLHRESWFLVLWAGLVFLFFSASQSKLIPYILPVLPPLALLLGRYLARAWDHSELLGPRRVFWLVLVLGLGMAFAVLYVRHHLPAHPRAESMLGLVGTHLYWMAAALLLAAVVPFAFSRWRNCRRTIASLLAVSVLVIAVFDTSLPRLNDFRSVKPLALILKPMLHPDDEVMAYQTYYQDLPVYLERRITVVGWKGELEFGMQVEDTSAWMIEEPAFWERWEGARRVYLLTALDNYDKLRAEGRGQFRLIAQSGPNVLVTNRMVQP